MITIKLTDLREFLRRSRAIKDSSIIPIHQYFRLQCEGDSAKITKTSGNSFIVHELASAKFKKDITLLLEIKMLSGFVGSASGELLTLKIKGNDIEYSDDRYTVRHQIVDAKDFPQTKSVEGASWAILNKDMLQSIGIAKEYCADNGVNKQWMDYIWVKPIKVENSKKKHICVFGTDAIILYFKQFEGDVPIIVMEKEIATVIQAFESVQYCRIGNYHYYDTGNSLYGFAELAIEFGAGQFEQVVAVYKKEVSFIIPKKEIVDFCDLVVSTSHLILANCYIEDAGKNKILLRHVDNGRASGGEAFIDVEKKKEQLKEFWFNPRQFQNFFKHLPYDKMILFQKDYQTFFVSSEEDPDYVGVIRGIVSATPVEAKTEKAKETA